MKNYTDLDGFASGVRKLNRLCRKTLGADWEQMPVLMEVDGRIAPFGLALQKNVEGVECVVLTGSSSSMREVSQEKRAEQVESGRKEKRG